MATLATPITFTLENKTVDQISIKSITYADNANITHHSDYSNFDFGGTDNTGNTSSEQFVKRYVTGDYLQRSYISDTSPITVYYSTHTGNTLTIKDSTTAGLYAGWTADTLGGDNAFDGLTIVSIGGPTTILLSGPPSVAIPNQGESIKFSFATNKLVINSTAGISAGWEIRDNGYSTPGNVISVEDSQTLVVDTLPTNPSTNPVNKFLFTSSTNYLTLNNTNNIEAGFTALSSDNAYDDSQYVLLVVDGTTVQMSDQPNSSPSTTNPENQITFTSTRPIVTIDAGQSTSFVVNYTNNNSTPAANLPSLLTINAKNLGNNSNIVGNVNNYVSINLPPPPPPTYTGGLQGGGGGSGRGGSGGASTAGPSVGHRGLSDGNQAIGNNPDGMGGQTGDGGGGSGGSRVICTHFYRKGMISREVWRADMEYTFKRLSPATVRGYQYWAIPYVKLMRRSPLAEKIMYPLMIARAEELAYKMGVLEKRNWAGVLVRLVFEPICFTIGLFVGEQDWKSLWTIKLDRNT